MIKEAHFIKRPFLRFTGGKQKLLPRLLQRLPHDFTKLQYYEPYF
jgi:site-specific DNA-adenine methylase